jgi:hypothetical protein
MDNKTPNARFDERQGCERVQSGDMFYFANGAIRENSSFAMMCDPPPDAYERLSNLLQFHRAKLTRAVKAFEEFRESLIMSGNDSGPAMEELKRLQSVVGERNLAAEQAKQALANTEQGKQLERNRPNLAAETERRQQAREKLRAVRI